MDNAKILQLTTELEIAGASIDEALDLLKTANDNVVPLHRHKKMLAIASQEIGVKEVSGAGNNRRIQEYLAYGSKSNSMAKLFPDSTPWCSGFQCFVVEKAGMTSVNSLTARDWLTWGRSVKSNPAPGDIVIYWRGSLGGWQGHVGIYLKDNSNGDILTLGGNQSDMVNCAWQDGDRVLDIRRSRLAPEYTANIILDLENMVKEIVDGKKLYYRGSVA